MLHNPISLFAYEALWSIISIAARAYAGMSSKFQAKLEEREVAEKRLKEWARIRVRYPKCAIFICSSAGEYEQAKPLLRRFSQQADTALFILFFSPSGTKFARSQKEALPFALVATDRPSYWTEVCTNLRPDFIFCVRYELWPGMVSVCKNFAPIFLIDAVESSHLREKRLARCLRSALVRSMKKVFVVAESDREFYEKVLKFPEQQIEVTGDTKYDRVLERMSERGEKLQELKTQLSRFLENKRVIVLGSAWPKDLEEFLSIYPQLKKMTPNLAVMIAPHDLGQENIGQMMTKFSDLNVCRVSTDGYASAGEETELLFVDVLGDLPELYGCADLAWVGGALHFRVHNVLEPACRGIYLCFGPLYETSQEAKVLVTEGLAQVIGSGPDFLEWYKNLSFDSRPPHGEMEKAVLRQKGASDRLMQTVTSSWRR